MQRPRSSTVVSLLCSAVVAMTPLAASADDDPPEPVSLAPVIITEVQTGQAARADEFIELHNTTDQPIELTGWQIRYVTASVTSVKNVEDPSSIIRLAPPVVDGQAASLPAHGYYLLYAGAVALPEGMLGQSYEALLPATGGSLVLVSPDDGHCELVVHDALAWGNTSHLFGEGEALVAGAASAADRLLQRFIDATGVDVDTGANAADFAADNATVLPAMASPGAANSRLLPVPPPLGSGTLSQTLPERLSNPDCTLPDTDPPADPPPPSDDSPPSTTEPPTPDPDADPQPTIPSGNLGLKAPLLSEFLPNPASPQTDKHDEFIELYNPNGASFDLSGYIVEIGLKTKRRHTFPNGTKIAPKAFLAFFSADTRLALSNSGGQVSLIDPLDRMLAASEPYGTAKDGQAWVLAGGKWQWTTKPTPNALNIISAPLAKTSSKKGVKTAATARTGTTGQSSGTSAEDTGQTTSLDTASKTPLHPGVLALIALSALLYGAYEYRRDLANKLYQFRSYRAARRAARQSAQGR